MNGVYLPNQKAQHNFSQCLVGSLHERPAFSAAESLITKMIRFSQPTLIWCTLLLAATLPVRLLLLPSMESHPTHNLRWKNLLLYMRISSFENFVRFSTHTHTFAGICTPIAANELDRAHDWLQTEFNEHPHSTRPCDSSPIIFFVFMWKHNMCVRRHCSWAAAGRASVW